MGNQKYATVAADGLKAVVSRVVNNLNGTMDAVPGSPNRQVRNLRLPKCGTSTVQFHIYHNYIM